MATDYKIINLLKWMVYGLRAFNSMFNQILILDMAKLVDPLVASMTPATWWAQTGRSEVATIERPGESSLSAWASLELNCCQECPLETQESVQKSWSPCSAKSLINFQAEIF